MSNFNKLVKRMLEEMAANAAAAASTFGDAAAAAAVNPAMQGDAIYNPGNALPVAPADLALGKRKKGKKVKIPVQRRKFSKM